MFRSALLTGGLVTACTPASAQDLQGAPSDTELVFRDRGAEGCTPVPVGRDTLTLNERVPVMTSSLALL